MLGTRVTGNSTSEAVPAAELHESEEDTDEDRALLADARYIVKCTQKTCFARLHIVGGCPSANDGRPGSRFRNISEAAYDAFCKHCFKQSVPIAISQVPPVPVSSSDESSSTVHSTDST